MTELKEHIEIFRETLGTHFEAWRVLIDPKEKLYPVYWKWDEGKFEHREFAVETMKRRYPNLEIRFHCS
ncbi:hypothetical protein [Sphingobacterium sp. UBA5996]|uniref:hypothetical protein n=1 Tax=Sphingobacterium sp. UBA5996 TaxID=1947505 RepID=UPI0025DD745E|nr:hypothetical protein [Sphingobacterium sp. UBA5996]